MMSDGPKAGAKWSKYAVEDGNLVRKSEFCPRCGPGVFLAVHADRSLAEGGYTENRMIFHPPM